MISVVLDFETWSRCDLKKAGAWRYSEDPSTEIICLAYSVDGQPPAAFRPSAYEPDHPFAVHVREPATMFVAHNAAFEQAIWENIMYRRLGWPAVPIERWHDTMAVCAMKSLPLKLERAAAAIRLGFQKDTEGTKETLAYGRLMADGETIKATQKFTRIVNYCKQDVRVEEELHRHLRGLGAAERKVWLLDQAINRRGIRLDLPLVKACRQICRDASVPLAKEFTALTGIEKPGSPALLPWLANNGVVLPNLQKETIDRALKIETDDSDAGDIAPEDSVSLPVDCRLALDLRRQLSSASVKKLAAMEACVATDGRTHGLLQYHGATTGRWAGRLLQPQNFPRPSLKVDSEAVDSDQLVSVLQTGDASFVSAMYGNPIEAVASGLRHLLIADLGNTFVVGDYSKIECVIVLALAGQQHTAWEVIEKGSAVYTDMASKIFKRPVAKTDLAEYTIGKHVVLGCGFQMGWRKFKSRYGANLPEELCQKAIREYRTVFAPAVPKLWYALEDAAVRCVWDARPVESYGIEYRLENEWLTARLPSGRKLWYFDPKPVRKAMPWSTPEEPDIRAAFEYSAWKLGQWKRIVAYGGLLTENVVQAMARDLLVNGMFEAEETGYPVVLTVHDEIVCEVPHEKADSYVLKQCMETVPTWARHIGIPVVAECWTGERYRK
ncbi:MAG: hypothetical protein KGJ13_08605 [Patescibacteria group bacterium]|nr:hypothetical protein [Patescibacteria group bacterium]